VGDLTEEARALGEATSPGSGHPKGWEPHVEEHGDTARAVSKPMDGSPTHDDLIRSWGMDPTEWAIVGDVQVRRWQTYDERWLRYFKANLTRRSRARQIDVEALSKRIARRTYPKPPASTGERWGRVICLNDWQLGKSEGGGSEATALFLRERFAMIDDLLRAERPPAVHILWVGDVTEWAVSILDTADELVKKYGPLAADVLAAARAFAESPGFDTAAELYARIQVLARLVQQPVPVAAINWQGLAEFAAAIARILKLFL